MRFNVCNRVLTGWEVGTAAFCMRIIMTHDTDRTALVPLGSPPETRPTRRKPRPVEATAEARRYVLREILAQNGLTVTALARRAGLPSPNALYNFLNGRTLSLSANSLAAIRAALPHVDLTGLVVGNLGAPASEPPAPPLALTYEEVQSTIHQPTDLVVGRPDPRDTRIAMLRQSMRRLEGEIALLRHLVDDIAPSLPGDD